MGAVFVLPGNGTLLSVVGSFACDFDDASFRLLSVLGTFNPALTELLPLIALVLFDSTDLRAWLEELTPSGVPAFLRSVARAFFGTKVYSPWLFSNSTRSRGLSNLNFWPYSYSFVLRAASRYVGMRDSAWIWPAPDLVTSPVTSSEKPIFLLAAALIRGLKEHSMTSVSWLLFLIVSRLFSFA